MGESLTLKYCSLHKSLPSLIHNPSFKYCTMFMYSLLSPYYFRSILDTLWQQMPKHNPERTNSKTMQLFIPAKTLVKTRQTKRRATKNGQSRETGDISAHKTKTTKKRVGHYYSQTNTNNINKTSALLQANEGKDELHMQVCQNENIRISNRIYL